MQEGSHRAEPDSLNDVDLPWSLLRVIILGLSNVNFATLLSASKSICVYMWYPCKGLYWLSKTIYACWP